MAYRYFAVIKKDDFATTKSNGGVVEKVQDVPADAPDFGMDLTNFTECNWLDDYYTEDGKATGTLIGGYIVKEVTADCKRGWIMQDKTGLIVDSAASSN